MLKRLATLVSCLLLVAVVPYYSEASPTRSSVFGPKKYKSTGRARVFTDSFSVPDASGKFILTVQNGEGRRGRASQAEVRVNGLKVVDAADLSPQSDLVQRGVALKKRNQISVRLTSEPGTWVVVKVQAEAHPGFPPGWGHGAARIPDKEMGITVSPDSIFVNEPQSVTITANIPYNSQQPPPAVILKRVDENGDIIATEGTLTDDGNLANGDEIAGDGIFSLRKTFSTAAEGKINLQIFKQLGPRMVANSQVFYIHALQHLSDPQINAVIASQDDAVQTYNGLVGIVGPDQARDAVLAQVQADPNVLQAGISESGNGVWMVHAPGIPGALLFNPPGTKGAPGPVGAAPGADRRLQGDLFTFVNEAADDKLRIGNKRAKVMAAFKWQFGSDDSYDDVLDIIVKSKCPTFEVTTHVNGDASINRYKWLDLYGLIFISSHGDSYYNGILSLWQDKWGWNGPWAQVAVLTGEQVTEANKKNYEIELQRGRLAIVNGAYYAILPSFITYWSIKFPNSLVYMSTCRGGYNSSMANAFLGQGAQVYLGYSDYVNAAWDKGVSKTFIDRFVKQQMKAGDAFISGQVGPKGEKFLFFGANELELPISGLENGGFEEGTMGAWLALGDGRVLTQLGEFTPIEGKYMGLISTGLGFTTSSGSVEQQLCLPTGAKWLKFWWNFNSEEFVEWCGWWYQDFFRVDIVTETGTQNLFYRRINDLCGMVLPSSLHFDQSGGGCEPFPEDVGYGTGGNDCLVWTTDWRFELIDISAIATANEGKTVTLVFSAGDVGDSIFDSAILLDGIEIDTE